MAKLKALIWDVDGIFVDTEALHYQAWKTLLERAGKTLSMEEYRPLVGRDGESNLKDLCRQKGISGDLKILNKERREIYRELRQSGIPLIPRNIELVRQIRSLRPHLKLAAASSSREQDVRENLRASGLEDIFACIVSFESAPGIARKPAGDIYRLVLEKLGCPAQDCVAFEDTSHGVAAAAAAKIRCVALPNELTENQDFSKAILLIPWQRPIKAQDLLRSLSGE